MLATEEAMNMVLDINRGFVTSFVLSIRLSLADRPLGLQQKMDWFFTCGSSSSVLFSDFDEAQAYDDFVDKVAFSNDVKIAICK